MLFPRISFFLKGFAVRCKKSSLVRLGWLGWQKSAMAKSARGSRCASVTLYRAVARQAPLAGRGNKWFTTLSPVPLSSPGSYFPEFICLARVCYRPAYGNLRHSQTMVHIEQRRKVASDGHASLSGRATAPSTKLHHFGFLIQDRGWCRAYNGLADQAMTSIALPSPWMKPFAIKPSIIMGRASMPLRRYNGRPVQGGNGSQKHHLCQQFVETVRLRWCVFLK